MKKILFVFSILGVMGVSASFAAAPVFVVQTAPQSNELSPVVVASTASISAVSISSFSATRVDSTFNAAALSALGATYARAELTIQNKSTGERYCGYSPSAVTTDKFTIAGGATWSFSLGKGIAVYCLDTAGASGGTLTVGGIAWK